MGCLITTLGPREGEGLGIILPHEHVFVDLRRWNERGYAQAKTPEVIAQIGPEIEKAQKAGIGAIIECSAVGVGRRADILSAVSRATGFPLLAPTGIYREPWVPAWAHAAGEAELRDWMVAELTGEIEGSGVQAGWIKLSAGDDGLTHCETKILHAAARAGAATNALIGSHTIRGSVVADQLQIVETTGYSPERFVWIHAHVEPDFALNLEMAHRGAWIEYDAIGADDATDDLTIERIQRMLDAGYGDQVLLSQDRGWYDPAQPRGGIPRPYTHITENFLPRLQAAGIDAATVHQLTHANPLRAFAR